MSILEKMRQYEEQKKLRMLEGSGAMPESETPDVVIQSMGLRPRKPSIKSMIGDNNPLTQKEFDELSQLFKFGRTTE